VRCLSPAIHRDHPDAVSQHKIELVDLGSGHVFADLFQQRCIVRVHCHLDRRLPEDGLFLDQTCRNLNINPQENLEDILRRIMSYPASRFKELLPDLWLAARQQNAAMQTADQDGLG
jgi:hypothetical protein